MCDVSIVIVNYRSEKLICDAVESVVSHTEGVDYEIIVVDNDPSAESRAVLGELSWVSRTSIGESGSPSSVSFRTMKLRKA